MSTGRPRAVLAAALTRRRYTLAARLVEGELKDLVGAQMRHEDEAVGVVDADRVRVARCRDHLQGFADFTVRPDWINADLVTSIGRAKEKASTLIERDVGIAVCE